MVFPSMNNLKHALSTYTVEAFLMLEKAFIDDAAYNYKEVESSACYRSFKVWGVRVASEPHGENQMCFNTLLLLIKSKTSLNVLVRCLQRLEFCVPIA